MLRNIQSPARQGVYWPIASHETDEHLTGANFVNGLPIYRRTVLVPGALNSSTLTIGALAGVMQFLVTASWTGLDVDNDTFRYMRASTQNGLDVVQSTGAVTIFHQGFDFSGEFIVLTLEYTKLGGN